MSPSAANHKRRRVLIEIAPSWGEAVWLWLHKLRYPRERWLGGMWGSTASKSADADPSPPAQG